ncbi:acetyltransferase [Sporomusa malonica]|uniref:Sugar O-acyltransferase, sialic acid O-acetyltransferase NeuD family n=1 Tax=Sporomusa malonica TaxID=112901 RepID=A0A1W1YUB4_9FIRM|nr:acetyltransferase [Sporomusa malonica]SMC39411.1 sugar O-acyltransferase, sialic acid O-acetyltransferase NeuD family [Sporomusa malonica]
MNKKLLLIGGGGHCKSVLDSLLSAKTFNEIGIVDVKGSVGKSVLEIPIIGCDDDLEKLYQHGYTYAFVSLGSVGNPVIRIKIFNKLESIGFGIPNVIDPTATVSKRASLTSGIYIGKNVVVNVGTSIGKGAILNTSSTIEHECSIGEFVHISPGAVLCGEVQIGEHTHVGAKSVVKQQVKIGSRTLIGMGSVVLHDVAANTVAYGNPCKEVSTR